jgi:hypothetical protein
MIQYWLYRQDAPEKCYTPVKAMHELYRLFSSPIDTDWSDWYAKLAQTADMLLSVTEFTYEEEGEDVFEYPAFLLRELDGSSCLCRLSGVSGSYYDPRVAMNLPIAARRLREQAKTLLMTVGLLSR